MTKSKKKKQVATPASLPAASIARPSTPDAVQEQNRSSIELESRSEQSPMLPPEEEIVEEPPQPLTPTVTEPITIDEDREAEVGSERKSKQKTSEIWQHFKRIIVVERGGKKLEVGKMVKVYDPDKEEEVEEVVAIRKGETKLVLGFCKHCKKPEEFQCGQFGTSSSLWKHLEIEHIEEYEKTQHAMTRSKSASKAIHQPSIGVTHKKVLKNFLNKIFIK